jgi:hypothetical protein
MAYVIGWPKGAFEVLPGMDAEEWRQQFKFGADIRS